MKRASRFFVFLLLMCLVVPLTGFSPKEKQLKATWIWHTKLIASEPEQILSFAKEQGVNLLYLNIDQSRKAAFYQSFIKKANAAGIKVHALGGERNWAMEQNRAKVLALVDWVIAYNKSVAVDEKISGIHLDIEPYLLPEWKTKQASVLRQWKANVQVYIKRSEQDPILEVGCDIPFWLDKTSVPGDPKTTMAQWLISQHDHVAVMAYRDRAKGSNSISSLVLQELRWADQLGKKVVVAVETKQSTEGNFVSFYEEGKAHLNAELSKLPVLMSSHPSFAGIAIHSYEHWKTLKK